MLFLPSDLKMQAPHNSCAVRLFFDQIGFAQQPNNFCSDGGRLLWNSWALSCHYCQAVEINNHYYLWSYISYFLFSNSYHRWVYIHILWVYIKAFVYTCMSCFCLWYIIYGCLCNHGYVMDMWYDSKLLLINNTTFSMKVFTRSDLCKIWKEKVKEEQEDGEHPFKSYIITNPVEVTIKKKNLSTTNW